jgi:hypothetical protein
MPARPHLGHHRSGRHPPVDREREGRFGDERVAAYHLERRAGRVGNSLVVAGHHPVLAVRCDADLRRAADVPRRVQRDRDVAQPPALAPLHGLQRQVSAQPVPQQRLALARGEVGRAPVSGVVGMRMRDDRPCHRTPRIDEEVAGIAVQPVRGGAQQRRRDGHVVEEAVGRVSYRESFDRRVVPPAGRPSPRASRTTGGVVCTRRRRPAVASPGVYVDADSCRFGSTGGFTVELAC